MSQENKETIIKIENEDETNCVIQESPNTLKISSVYRMTEPFVITKTNVKLKSDEVKVINTSGQSSITIKTPSQINKPLCMVVHKNLEPPKSINIIRMGNTTVKPVRQFITRVPTVSSNPSLKLVLDPKQNEARSLVRASGDYVKQLETDNNNLRKLLTEVRRESIGKSIRSRIIIQLINH